MSIEALHNQFFGKTVRLISGGPVMTVEAVVEIDASIKLECCWFDDMKLERALLLPESVELADVPRGSMTFF